MKKVLALLLVLALAMSLCACGGKTEPEIDSAADSSSEVTPLPEETITPLHVDLNGQNTLTIEGNQYALPMSLKEFMNSGWNDTYEHMDEKIDADKGKEYPSFTLDKNGEEKISGLGAYNHTGSEISISESTLISLKLVGVPDDSRLTTCSFTLPGGITEKSTYEDVLATYGTKTQSESFRVADDYESKVKDAANFEKYGFTVLYRTNDATTVPYNYTFAFNADKTIKYVNVESADYKSAASAAFSK